MSERNIKIEKSNRSFREKSNVVVSVYAEADLDTCRDVKKDLDDFHNYINQKYNQQPNNSIIEKNIFDTFLDYLKSLI